MIGSYWCQRDQVWVRFRNENDKVVAEIAKGNENWELLTSGEWPTSYGFDQRELKEAEDGQYGYEKSFVFFVFEEDGSLFRTMKASTGIMIASRWDVTTHNWVSLSGKKATEIKNKYTKDTESNTTYAELPKHPDLIKKAIAKAKTQWNNYLSEMAHRNRFLARFQSSELKQFVNNFMDEKNLEFYKTNLFDKFHKVLSSLWEKFYSGTRGHFDWNEELGCKSYLEALKEIITGDNHLQGALYVAASTTDLENEYIKLTTDLSLEEKSELIQSLIEMKKSFFMEILCQEFEQVVGQFKIEGITLSPPVPKEESLPAPPIEPAVLNPDLPLLPESPKPTPGNTPPTPPLTSIPKPKVLVEDLPKTSPIPAHNLLKDIKDSVKLAQKKYEDWYKNKTYHRTKEGFLTRLRHGQGGQDFAKKFLQGINAAEDLTAVQSIINDFLKAKSTRYHNHSFAAFLLDELRGLKESPWQSVPHLIKTSKEGNRIEVYLKPPL